MHIGTIEKPVLVFGGPYRNLGATQALLDRAVALDIPPERMICTGDTVAYCAEPEATTDVIRNSGMHVGGSGGSTRYRSGHPSGTGNFDSRNPPCMACLDVGLTVDVSTRALDNTDSGTDILVWV